MGLVSARLGRSAGQRRASREVTGCWRTGVVATHTKAVVESRMLDTNPPTAMSPDVLSLILAAIRKRPARTTSDAPLAARGGERSDFAIQPKPWTPG